MLITNVIICDVNGEREADVRIEDGIITEMGSNLNGEEPIDATGAYLIPAIVDTNVRLLDSSLNAKNIKHVTEQAKKGGVGHIVLNADSNPAIDNEVVLEFAQYGLDAIEDVKVDLMLNTLKEDMSLSNIAILLKKGIVAPYMSTIAKNDIAIKIAEYIQMYKVTLFCKAEDNSLMNAGVMLDGDVSSKLGLAGIPNLSEVLHVSRMIEIAKHFKIKILFKAIASPRSVELIAKAKKDGVDVTCEVSIHHLVNCDEACEDFNTIAKLNPPLASREDMLLLQKALKNGDIDLLTTLHQPSSPLNKEVAFFDAAYGCESIADASPLYYTKLVRSGLISMRDLVRMTSTNPLSVINKESCAIEVGKRAEFIIADTKGSVTVSNISSLYNEEKLYGTVKFLSL